MQDNNTLLSFIAQRHASDREDVATDAFVFILSRSNFAKQALSDFLGDDSGSLPIVQVRPWAADAHGAIPDLACFDENDDLVALIESKFWAPLTHHQPVTYWQGLQANRNAVLLFLAPDFRVNQGALWNELLYRLANAGHELHTAKREECLVTALAKTDHRRLMLTCWRLLLDRLTQRAEEEGDIQACFEIAELQGLAATATADDAPQRDENLKRLISDAVKRVEKSGWANTDGLTAGAGIDYYARYIRIAGAFAGLRIDYKAVKQMPDKPLWLTFYHDPEASVSIEAMRSKLASLAEPGLEWLSAEACTPIALPAGADRDATLDAIVAELARIAKLIDPDGPTYRKAC